MKTIFCFGSNLAGRHGAGAALFAAKHHGAIYGVGEGIQGNSYGIPTKDYNLKVIPLEKIKIHVEVFKDFARRNPTYFFRLTAIGCGLAGYKPEQIAPMFEDAPDNVDLPDEFREVLYGKI